MRVVLGSVHRRVDWLRVLFWLSLTTLWVIFGFSGTKAFATDNSQLWTNNLSVVSSRGVTGNPGYKTGCKLLSIVMKSGEFINEACVYGDQSGTRVASFTPGSGGYRYAVAFPGSSDFYTLSGVCENVHGCAYGQAADAFIARSDGTSRYSLIRDFSKKLQKHQGVATYFSISGDDSVSLPVGVNPINMGAFSLSKSGEWAVFELRSYGFMRINLSTQSQIRVSAPGYTYGLGSDPTANLAISDDGSTIAVSGYNVSTEIFQVTPGCGGEVSSNMQANFAAYDYPCHRLTISTGSLFSNFIGASRPTLSYDGTVLGLDVYQGGVPNMQRVTIQDSSNPAAAYSRDDSIYLAFGDSFTSGEGETDDFYYHPETNTGSNKCHVSVRSYPYLVGSRWNMATKNHACSGSRIQDVNEAVSNLAANTAADDVYVSIGVGGNDIGLMGKLASCVGIGTCEWAKSEKRKATYDEIHRQKTRLEATVSEAKQLFPGAKIALIGYPQVVNVGSSNHCSVLINTALNQDERLYLDASVQELNRVIYNAAMSQSVNYVSVNSALHGIRLCDESEAGMNAVRFGADIAPIKALGSLKIIGSESFHPTPTGHEAIAASITAIHPTPWDDLPCSDCSAYLGVDYNDYWNPPGVFQSMTAQYSSRFLSKVNLEPDDRLVAARFGPGSFSPGSEVSFEIHSSPVSLTKVISDLDGSLRVDLNLPDSYKGDHTIHALGSSFTGEDVDYYQAIALDSYITAEQNDPVENDEVGGSGGSKSEVDTDSNNDNQAAGDDSPVVAYNGSGGGGPAGSSPSFSAKSFSLPAPISSQLDSAITYIDDLFSNLRSRLPSGGESSVLGLSDKKVDSLKATGGGSDGNLKLLLHASVIGTLAVLTFVILSALFYKRGRTGVEPG